MPDTFVYTRREPVGVVAAITPWNFPIAIPAWKIAPALISGNAVVLKPAELTPVSVWHLSEVLTQAGLPPGVLNVVYGDGAVAGRALVYRSPHGGLVRRRAEWFLSTPQPSTALWWVLHDYRPALDGSRARLTLLRHEGPSPRAFSNHAKPSVPTTADPTISPPPNSIAALPYSVIHGFDGLARDRGDEVEVLVNGENSQCCLLGRRRDQQVGN